MSMVATKGPRGQEMATATCDDCGAQDAVPASHTHHGGTARGGHVRLKLMNEGLALKKLEKAGWALVANKLRCPACEAKRKAANPTPKQEAQVIETKPKATAEAPRQPTPAIKRQIIGLLEDAYDDDAKRYRNPADNDKSIAEVIGDGCLWGWVAAIREELFGPDTRNAEIEEIRAEVTRLEGVAGNLMGEIVKVEAAVAELRGRLDKAA